MSHFRQQALLFSFALCSVVASRPIDAYCQTVLFGDRELAWLAEGEESSFDGAAVIATGKGDRGGVSYGTYQMSSKMGSVKNFVDKMFPGEFDGLTPGNKDFTKKWLELVDKDEDAFAAREYEFIQKTHYDPVLRKLQKEFGDEIANRGLAFKNAVFSIAVQHGETNGAGLIAKAIRSALDGKPLSKLSDADLIEAIYNERMSKNSDGTLAYFGKNSAKVQKGVFKRLQRERISALGMDAVERLRREVDAKGGAPKKPPLIAGRRWVVSKEDLHDFSDKEAEIVADFDTEQAAIDEARRLNEKAPDADIGKYVYVAHERGSKDR